MILISIEGLMFFILDLAICDGDFDTDMNIPELNVSFLYLPHLSTKPKLTFDETSNVTLIIGFDSAFVGSNATEWWITIV